MARSQEVQRGPASTQLKSATVTPESGNGSPSDNPGLPGASQLLGGQPKAPAEDGVVVAPQARRHAADAHRRLRELVRRRRRPDGRAAGERYLLDEAPRPHLLRLHRLRDAVLREHRHAPALGLAIELLLAVAARPLVHAGPELLCLLAQAGAAAILRPLRPLRVSHQVEEGLPLVLLAGEEQHEDGAITAPDAAAALGEAAVARGRRGRPAGEVEELVRRQRLDLRDVDALAVAAPLPGGKGGAPRGDGPPPRPRGRRG